MIKILKEKLSDQNEKNLFPMFSERKAISVLSSLK